MWFGWHDRPRVLPVWLDGELQLMHWGCQRWEQSPAGVPLTQVVRLASLDANALDQWHPKLAEVPASALLIGRRAVWVAGLEAGMLRAVVLEDGNQRRVYLLMKEPDHYWTIMTGDQWMPLLNPKAI